MCWPILEWAKRRFKFRAVVSPSFVNFDPFTEINIYFLDSFGRADSFDP